MAAIASPLKGNASEARAGNRFLQWIDLMKKDMTCCFSKDFSRKYRERGSFHWRTPMKPFNFHPMSTRCFCSISLLALFCAGELPAQRESFDTTVIRQRSEIAGQLSAASETQTVIRMGVDIKGARQKLSATQAAQSFDNIYFKLDSTELRDEASRLQLLEIAAALQHPKLAGQRYLIEGHTCDLGAKDYNLLLSVRRAEAIRQFFIKAGVAAERMAVLGFGEEEPAVKLTAPDGTAEGERQRMQNRRVVLRVLPRESKK